MNSRTSKEKAIKGDTKSNDIQEYVYVPMNEDSDSINGSDTAWNQLKMCYASSTADLQELANLLESWNLFDLFELFVSK